MEITQESIQEALSTRKVTRAMEWLTEFLKEPRYSEELFMEARVQGFTKGTVYRAAQKMPIKKAPIIRKNGQGAIIWTWQLEKSPHWLTCPYCQRRFPYLDKPLTA